MKIKQNILFQLLFLFAYGCTPIINYSDKVNNTVLNDSLNTQYAQLRQTFLQSDSLCNCEGITLVNFPDRLIHISAFAGAKEISDSLRWSEVHLTGTRYPVILQENEEIKITVEAGTYTYIKVYFKKQNIERILHYHFENGMIESEYYMPYFQYSDTLQNGLIVKDMTNSGADYGNYISPSDPFDIPTEEDFKNDSIQIMKDRSKIKRIYPICFEEALELAQTFGIDLFEGNTTVYLSTEHYHRRKTWKFVKRLPKNNGDKAYDVIIVDAKTGKATYESEVF